MTSLARATLDPPERLVPSRSSDLAWCGVPGRGGPVVRRRIRLDQPDRTMRTTRPVAGDRMAASDRRGHGRRSWSGVAERAFRYPPFTLRASLLLVTAAAVLSGVMVVTLGVFGVTVLAGLAVSYRYASAPAR
jgi:hypothetical protein